MRVLVPGGAGMVARMLAERARARGHDVEAVPHAQWDIADVGAARDRLARHRPDVLVNCAAFTDVDACESLSGEAMRANGEAPGVLARACAAAGVPLVHLSSDYVFDGTAREPYGEAAPTNPLSAYGASKLAGERAVAEAGGASLVVRTAWVYGPWGRCFPAAILRLAREQGELRIVDDQEGSPTSTADLADAILNLAGLAGKGARGVVHFTNAGRCSWHAFAREIVRLAGLSVPVHPVPTSAFPRPARRPAFSCLSLARYRALTGSEPRPWAEALAEFMRGLHPAGAPAS